MNYLNDIRIDENSLDIEWLEQAELAVKYGRYWSKCKEELIRAEEEIKVVRAELIALANSDPDKHLGDGVKPTGPNVESFYRNHKRHKAAKERWIKALTECNDAEIIKNEIAFTRKAALEAMVQLHGQQYFAGPKMPRDLVNEHKNWAEKRKQTREESNQKVRRIRRT
jgi:hypothetical protein